MGEPAQRPTVGVVNFGLRIYPHDVALPLVGELAEIAAHDLNIVDLGQVFTFEEAMAKVGEVQARDLDLVVIFFGTWVDPSYPVSFIRELGGTRVVLWAIPMVEGCSTGSLVSLTVVKPSLERMGIAFDWVYGIPAEVKEGLVGKALLGGIVKRLRRMRIGLIGYGAWGMYTATFDHLMLKDRIGPEVIHIDQSYMLSIMEKIPEEQVLAKFGEVSGRFPLRSEELRRPAVDSIRMYFALQRLLQEFSLDSLSIKCQPELSRSVGCSCISLSLLCEEGGVVNCEGDIHGLLSMIFLNSLTGRDIAFADLVNAQDNTLWFSSCGFVSPSLVDGAMDIKRQVPAIGEAGVVFSGAPKTGGVTLCRLEQDAGGGYRMHIGRGEVVEGYRRRERTVSGVEEIFPIWRVDLRRHSNEFLENVLANHYAITYGDAVAGLMGLAGRLGIRVVGA